MSTYDPTEELVRAMLARRADGPPPAWLLTSTMNRVATTRQAGRRSWLALPERTRPRVALAATAVLLLAALVGGALAAGGFLDTSGAPEPTQPAGVVTPTVLPSPSVEPSISPAAPSPSPAPTPRPVPGALAADTLAVVTKAGNDLRVKTAPGVGADSKRLTPLLKSGTRMLVISGPVPKDGYDWYEVVPDEDPGFGWVASGKDGAAWIRPVAPRCPATLDEAAVTGLSPIEFFACFGAEPVYVRAFREVGREADTGDASPACDYTSGSEPCKATPRWLFEPLFATLVREGQPAVIVAAPAAMRAKLAAVPEVANLTLVLAMDHARATDCRLVDRRGRDLIPRDEAIARCRLRFVVTSLAWDPAMVVPQEDDLATVIAPTLPVHPQVGKRATGPTLGVGSEIVIVGGPELAPDGTPWLAVVPRAMIGGPAGWVPFLDNGAPTLKRISLDCPAPGDWPAITALDRAARISCFAGKPKMTFKALLEPLATGPTGGPCRVYAELVDPNRTCEATPAWLTWETGISAANPDDDRIADNVWFDPSRIDLSKVPAGPTLMRVTGRFWHPSSSECRVVDPETDEPIVWGPAAWRYCAGQFVVTKLDRVP